MDELSQIAVRVTAVEQARTRQILLPGPWTLEVYPTLRCNLDCRFCDTTDRHRPAINELSPQRWLEILDEAAGLGAQSLMILGGGEPMISNATLPLIQRARHHGLHGFLTTNGTLLSPTTRKVLLESQWNDIHVSIDGASPRTHDALRGRPGSFVKTISAVCALRKERGNQEFPRIALHVVITRTNHTEIPALLRLAHAIGAHRVEFDHLIAYRPAQKALTLSSTEHQQLTELAHQSLAIAAELGLTTTLSNLLTPRGSSPPAPSAKPGISGSPCLKAWHHLTIQADGKVSPCCVLAGEGGSLASGSLQQLWTHDNFLETVRRGMLSQTPLPRCQECSMNILAHEHQIRARIPGQESP